MTRRKLFGYGSRFHAWNATRRLRKRGWPVTREARLTALADENGCVIVHAPEIWGAYCETHHYPVLPGEADADHLEKARHP